MTVSGQVFFPGGIMIDVLFTDKRAQGSHYWLFLSRYLVTFISDIHTSQESQGREYKQAKKSKL